MYMVFHQSQRSMSGWLAIIVLVIAVHGTRVGVMHNIGTDPLPELDIMVVVWLVPITVDIILITLVLAAVVLSGSQMAQLSTASLVVSQHVSQNWNKPANFRISLLNILYFFICKWINHFIITIKVIITCYYNVSGLGPVWLGLYSMNDSYTTALDDQGPV